MVQLSGLVLGEDSTSALPGVNVYVPTIGRGTVTNQYGYFSMPVLPGDSVLFRRGWLQAAVLHYS